MFNFLKNKIEDSYLSNSFLFQSTTGDGRIESAESEIFVIEHLKALFNDDKDIEVITVPPQCKRHWYDVLIKVNNQVFPINIKITSGNGSDNVSSKEGLFYALTGLWPETTRGLARWESYNTLLTTNFNASLNTDYYFVVYFKEDETFLFSSLKRINELVSNGNNLPFQCNWSKNCNFTNRTVEEQSYYLMDVYFQSWIKKLGGFEPLMKWKENN